MWRMDESIALALLSMAALAATAPRVKRRLELSVAKHPSLAGHSRIAARLARLIPGTAYQDDRFFGSDGAPETVRQARRDGLDRLAEAFREKFPRSLEQTAAVGPSVPDLQFTGSYRVPFQYSAYLRRHLRVGAFLETARGVRVTDIDGNEFLDVSGSYGVNLFGVDFYRDCIAQAVREAAPLGPVLGSYHPSVAFNVEQLKKISGLDQVSFHMSGTEAVMQAVRLARYHTGRTHLVRFCGAYHGWWDDVQPGPGNPTQPRHTYTLRDLDERSLRVLRTRRDIACVLVNPLQSLHPNRPAPGDSSLVDSSRQAGVDREAYSQWLGRLREVCTERGIVLILDEVFTGFRLAPRGAQEYFGVQADMVTYGKTLGGGLPVGVVCGRADLMKRYRDDRPVDICFARGTFNSHPYVMAAMQAFLERLDSPSVRGLYETLDETWDTRARCFNDRMQMEGLPVRAAHLSSIWTLQYTTPSRYNWMLQFYLRAHGLALSWVGTGRLIFSLNYQESDFDAVLERFVAAGIEMKRDGWWWNDGSLSNRSIRRAILGEWLGQAFGRQHAQH
jgi:glutamate-1-semialdehyde 2,1-aminomutase